MKTNLDSTFKTNTDSEKNGIWFELNKDTAFLLRAFKATNPKVKATMAQHYKPFARQIELGTLDEAKGREIQIKVFVDACLVDWRGVEIDGKKAEYDRDTAIKLLNALPDLYETLWKHVNDFRNYQDQELEDLGNS